MSDSPATRRHAMAAIPAGALTACGGGGGAAPRTFGWYGHSLAYGDVPGGRLEVPPAVRLALLTGCGVADYSLGAATCREALGARSLWAELPYPRLPFPPFVQHIRTAPETDVVLWYGAAEAVLGETVENYMSDLGSMVSLALQAGRRVHVVGLYKRPDFDRFDLAGRIVAEQCAVPFISLQEVPFDPATDLVDGLHGTQAQSDRWVSAIAGALR